MAVKTTTFSSAADQPEQQSATKDKDSQLLEPQVLSEKHQRESYIVRKLQEALCHHDTEPEILQNS